jgi:hypothetical protein
MPQHFFLWNEVSRHRITLVRPEARLRVLKEDFETKLHNEKQG